MTGPAFDREIATTSEGEGRWSAYVSDQWNIASNPNGGYLLAVVLAALRQLSSHPDPLTVTTHFLRPGSSPQPAAIDGHLVRAGRSITTVTGGLRQDGTERVRVIAAFGDLADPAEPVLTLAPPAMPGPDECHPRSGLEQGIELPIANRLETRIHPDQARAGQAERAEISGWIRFSDGRRPDPLALVLFADAFPPAVFGLLGMIGWVPTVELTVHVRRRPAPGWIQGHFACRDLSGGRFIEDGTLWDESGALVARSRQVGLLPTVPPVRAGPDGPAR